MGEKKKPTRVVARRLKGFRDIPAGDGLKLMRVDGWSKVLHGMTTIEEIVRVTKTDVSAVV